MSEKAERKKGLSTGAIGALKEDSMTFPGGEKEKRGKENHSRVKGNE